MVKKTKLLDRLFSKWRGEDAAPSRGTSAAPNGGERTAGGRTGGREAGRQAGGGEAGALEAVRTTRKEDAVAAVTAGLSELGNLLRGVQSRMEGQNERTDKLIGKFDDLPAAARAQAEFLSSISRQLEESKNRTEELSLRLGELPDLLKGIRAVLERQAATEERTEGTLLEFRNTMGRMNDAIATLSREHASALKETYTSFERTHVQSVRVFEQTQKEAVQAFKLSQENQGRQLAAVLERGAKMNRAILVFMIMIFAALVSIFLVVLAGQ